MGKVHVSEAGSSLVIALAFLSVFALWISTTLASASSSVKVGQSLRSERPLRYAVDAAVDHAIQTIRLDSSKGKDDGGTSPCHTESTFNNHTIYVHCTPQPRSGVPGLGGSSPTLGILTLATGSEVGYQHKSNDIIRVNGGVYSNSSITSFGGNYSQLNTCPPSYPTTQAGCTAQTPNPHGTVTAVGNCDIGTKDQNHNEHIVASIRNCNATPSPAGWDPGYPPDQLEAFASPAVPSTATACPSGYALVPLLPGRYGDDKLNALNALSSGCDHSLLWFQPGTYYFDFDGVWNINRESLTIVAGQPAWGALPADPSTVPFGSSCNADPIADHPGTEFIFGKTARMDVQKGRFEICSPVSALRQQIAIYGVKANTGTTLKAQSGCVAAVGYSGNEDGQHCALLTTGGNNSWVMVHGTIYAPAAVVEFKMTNVGYQVVSRGIIARVLSIHVTPSTVFTGAFISSPGFGSVTAADRDVFLTAYHCRRVACDNEVDPGSRSNKKLQAHVTFQDTPSPGSSVTVESWTVVR
jgi:hypothetical protein